MFPINTPPVVLPKPTSPIHFIKTLTETFSFTKGDLFRALVVQKSDNHEVLLDTGGGTLLAKSNLALKIGDTLLLKVDETQPNIILNLMPAADEDSLHIRNNLALFRAIPQGMVNVIKNGLEFFQGDIQNLLPFLEKAELDSLQSRINSLIFSEKSLDNPLFFKQFIINIGFLIEKSLKKSLSVSLEEEKSLSQTSNKSLKCLLSHLSSRLHLFLSDKAGSDFDSQLLNSLENLARYADSSLETIYNQQVVNVIGQEEEQSYYFQIPINSCDNDLRTADLFINIKDKNARSTTSDDQFQFVLFFNMDALGDIMVDIKYNQKKILGTFKCDNVDSRDFLKEFLEILNDRLSSAGYGPNYLNVCCSGNLFQEKVDFIHDKVIYSKKIINCFA
ncbi:hypothetical protein SAMN04489760_11190 [Syntrophus gentianae]|uniref:Hook-length control protein FliK n=1 Tax=Syntrophus gentianae TaxID=43775 RepID=A0A1H7XPK1_9BACT|nr:hypothetical protein [Syntrophus gentianae]SEM35563.1 hypothetical protein SAMN04489760_11190 [Syntrophus gentianae]